MQVVCLLSPYCERIEVAGSIRREKPYPNDIEVLVIPKYAGPIDLLDQRVQRLIGDGILSYRLNKMGRKMYGKSNKLLTHVASGIGVDVFSTDAERWAVALVLRTGGERTSKQIASAAIGKGWRFRAYGSGFDTPSGHIKCHSEKEVFEAVGLAYLKPWERE